MDSKPKSKINKFWQDKKIVMDPITTLKNILIKQIEKVKFIILFFFKPPKILWNMWNIKLK